MKDKTPKTLFVTYDDEGVYNVNAVGFPSPEMALIICVSREGNVSILNPAGITEEGIATIFDEATSEFKRRFKR